MVTKLLEKAIEIEGLLRIIRDGKPLPETYELLSNKAVELAESVMMLEEHAEYNEPEIAGDPIIQDELQAQDLESEPKDIPEQEESTEQEVPTEQEEPIKQEEPPAQVEPTAPEAPFEHEGEAEDETEEDDDILLTIEDEEISEAYGNVGEIEVDETLETTDVPAAKQPMSTISIEGAAKNTLKRKVKLKSAFSLNDRFLYSRELFDGNMKMFDSTLDFIEGIEEFSIIEDYFYSELEWDPENGTVAAFMEILRPHFRE